MESIPRIAEASGSADLQALFDMFFEIDRNARLSGKGEVIMRLDRVPNLVLGPENRVSEGASEAAVADSFVALQSILSELEANKHGRD